MRLQVLSSRWFDSTPPAIAGGTSVGRGLMYVKSLPGHLNSQLRLGRDADKLGLSVFYNSIIASFFQVEVEDRHTLSHTLDKESHEQVELAVHRHQARGLLPDS